MCLPARTFPLCTARAELLLWACSVWTCSLLTDVHAAICAGSAGVREPPDSPGSPESAAPAAAAAARRGGARQALWPDAPQRPSDAPGAGSPLRPSLQQPAQTHLLAAAMQEWPWAGEHTGAAM